MSRRKKRKSAFSLFAFQDIITAVTGIMLLITLLLTLELVERKAKASQNDSAPVSVSENTTVSSEELARLEAEVAAIKKRLAAMASENTILAQYDAKQLQADLQKTREANRKRPEIISNLKKRLAAIKKVPKKTDITQETLSRMEKQIRQAKANLEKMQKSNRIFIEAAQGSSKTNWLVEVTATKLKVAQLGKTTAPISFEDVHDFQSWLKKQDPASDHFVIFVKVGGTLRYKQVTYLLNQEGYSKGFDVLQSDNHVIDDTTGAGIP